MRVSATAAALHLPFVGAFSHAAAERSRSSSIVVRLQTDDGTVGFGEGCPREYVTGETLEGTLRAFEALRPAVEGGLPNRIEDVTDWLDERTGAGAPSLRCALECAALDVLGKRTGRSVAELLGVRAERVRYSAVIANSAPNAARRVAERCAAVGFADVKVKVDADLGANLARVRAVREALGDDVTVRVDANMAWATYGEAARQTEQLLDLGVWCVEQPMARDALQDTSRLDSAFPGCILLDEAIVSDTDLERVLDTGFGGRVLLKVSKNGGPLGTLRMKRRLDAAGVPAHLGTHVGETSLLSAAGRVVAGVSPFSTVEGSAGRHLLAEDLVAQPLEFGLGGWAPTRYGEGSGWQLAVRDPPNAL